MLCVTQYFYSQLSCMEDPHDKRAITASDIPELTTRAHSGSKRAIPGISHAFDLTFRSDKSSYTYVSTPESPERVGPGSTSTQEDDDFQFFMEYTFDWGNCHADPLEEPAQSSRFKRVACGSARQYAAGSPTSPFPRLPYEIWEKIWEFAKGREYALKDINMERKKCMQVSISNITKDLKVINLKITEQKLKKDETEAQIADIQSVFTEKNFEIWKKLSTDAAKPPKSWEQRMKNKTAPLRKALYALEGSMIDLRKDRNSSEKNLDFERNEARKFCLWSLPCSLTRIGILGRDFVESSKDVITID